MDLIPGGSDRLKGIDSATDAMRPRLFGLCFAFFSTLFFSTLFFSLPFICSTTKNQRSSRGL